jgi:penicillin-binding protein 1C
MMRRLWLALLGGLTCTAATCLAPASSRVELALPSYAEVRASYRPSDVNLLDRNGDVLHELRLNHYGRRLAWTPLEDISPALQAAVIASEDRRFYWHGGVDGLALLASVARWVGGQPRRGASTLSM